jgi:hypothetical protein
MTPIGKAHLRHRRAARMSALRQHQRRRAFCRLIGKQAVKHHQRARLCDNEWTLNWKYGIRRNAHYSAATSCWLNYVDLCIITATRSVAIGEFSKKTIQT